MWQSDLNLEKMGNKEKSGKEIERKEWKGYRKKVGQ
jgi:hypothetical protein